MIPQLINEFLPKARKKHYCNLCNGPIWPGDTYRRTTLVGDTIYDWLECKPCQVDEIALRVWEWAYGYLDEGITFEVALEWATETAAHGDTEQQTAAKRFLERGEGYHEPHRNLQAP